MHPGGGIVSSDKALSSTRVRPERSGGPPKRQMHLTSSFAYNNTRVLSNLRP